MGTSTPFIGGGNANPLLPSWLDDPSGAPGTAPVIPATPSSPTSPDQPVTEPAAPTPPPPAEKRYTPGRKAFNKGARSSDSDVRTRSFRRAASSYVSRSSGGAAGATARASGDRAAAGRFAEFLLRSGADGSDIRKELRRLNLASLAQRSTAEIFDALIDYVCEPGGDLDQAFVRDAYSEALALIPDDMVDRLDHPDSATINFVLENFIANTIMARLLNAVGNGAITLPETASSAVDLNNEFRDWVLGKVQDAMQAVNGVFREGQVTAQINAIYQAAYSILEDAGDDE